MTTPSSQTQPESRGQSSAPPSFADTYERHLVGPLFQPWAERLLERAELQTGENVLDVACGTGIVARLARKRVGSAARVVAVDKSPLMLSTARPLEATVDWREGDALQLPIGESERFDAVFCHQGLQFFADKLAGLREMRRALVAGGRVVLGVWRSADDNTLFGQLDRIAERFVGPFVDRRHSFPDVEALRDVLGEAGFQYIDVVPSTMETRFEFAALELARLNAAAAMGMSERGKTLTEEQRAATTAAIIEASLPVISRHTHDRVIRFETSANLATAR